MNIKTKAYIFITLALVGGALFPLALKVAVDNGVNTYAFLFFSYVIATITSFILVVAKGKVTELKGYIKNPREYLTIGVAGFAFAGLIFYGLIYAEQFLSATFATVIYRLQPLLMLLFIPLLLRERISKIQIVALMLGFVGIYIALTGGSLVAFSGANAGIVLVLLAVVLVSTFAAVFLKRYTTNMECTMFMFNSVSLVVATGLFLYSGAKLPTFNLNSIMALLYMGIPTSVFVTYFYFRAFRTLKTTFVTNIYCLSPFITAVFALVFLNETIEPYYLAIAILVAIGILIQRFDRRGGTYVAKNKRAVKNYLQMFDVTGAFLNTKVESIYSTMKGNGRVLAVKLDRELYDKIKETVGHGDAATGKPIFVYTTADKHLVSEDENKFISEIMGVNQNETILMSAGMPDASEEFFNNMQRELEAGKKDRHGS
jgi:drug/metabolite transporter (DMT)-like permease